LKNSQYAKNQKKNWDQLKFGVFRNRW